MMRMIRALTRRRPPGWNRRQAGNAARDAGNWITAVRAYEDYLALNPNDGKIWVQCGHSRKEAGDLAGAERAYRRAAAADPDDADPLFQLGSLMKRMERRDEAIRYYRQAVVMGLDLAVEELESLGVTLNSGDPPALSDTVLLRTLLDAQAARDLHRWLDAERLYEAYLRSVLDSAQAASELAAVRQAAR